MVHHSMVKETQFSTDFDRALPPSLTLMHNDRCYSSQHNFQAGLGKKAATAAVVA